MLCTWLRVGGGWCEQARKGVGGINTRVPSGCNWDVKVAAVLLILHLHVHNIPVLCTAEHVRELLLGQG